MPDGTWLTRYRDAPISRVWPPRKGAEEYADARFLTDRHLAYVRPDSEVRLTDMHQPRKVGPIDVVLTWVDGDDPAWRAKKALLTGTQAIRAADNDQRFHSRDELRYSLRSIFQHAPWVRNIYVVTDEQRPSWLGNSDRVRIIDHKEIFENPELLPVFNSHAIETQLHRIPGLSEWFLYMNDDMMLARDVKPSVFFSEDGLSQIFISQVSMIDRTRPAEACVPTDFAGFNMQDIIERDFGVVPCRKMLHAPYVLRKSIIEEIQARYHNEVKMTAASKLRSSTDIAIPSMFYHYYAWLTGRADLRKRGSERYTYIDTGKAGLNEALASTARNPPHFLCLNATEFDEVGKDREAELILQFLQRLYPTKMPFEI